MLEGPWRAWQLPGKMQQKEQEQRQLTLGCGASGVQTAVHAACGSSRLLGPAEGVRDRVCGTCWKNGWHLLKKNGPGAGRGWGGEGEGVGGGRGLGGGRGGQCVFDSRSWRQLGRKRTRRVSYGSQEGRRCSTVGRRRDRSHQGGAEGRDDGTPTRATTMDPEVGCSRDLALELEPWEPDLGPRKSRRAWGGMNAALRGPSAWPQRKAEDPKNLRP